MGNLPFYISILFIFTTLLTLWLLFKASSYRKLVIVSLIIWLAAQAIISFTGFYKISSGIPPRFVLLLLPPVILIAGLLITSRGRTFLDSFDAKTLTLLHVVRISVELALYLLFLHKALPEVMTFVGRNFDVLCGLTAPIIYYLGYIKKVFSRNILIVWNIICLFLLANIVVTAILSAPFVFQKFGFEQPNIALFYFPFVWLPAFVVPVALFAHIVSIRKLVAQY